MVPQQICYEDIESRRMRFRRFLRGLRGCSLFGGLVFVILYVSALILARTDGIRTQVAAELSSRLGVPISVHATALWPPCTLVARGVATTAVVNHTGVSFQLDRVRFVWGWPRRGEPALRRIEISGGHVRWRPDVTGSVATGDWARIEHVLSVAFDAVSPAPDASLPVSLRWRAQRFEALGENATSAFTAEVAEVHWTPIRVEERQFVHVRASARSLHGAGVATPSPWDAERLLVGNRQFDLRTVITRAEPSP